MNKPKRRWLDVQIVFASLAMTFILVLWNLFASGDLKSSAAQAAAQDQQVPDPTTTPVPTAASTASLPAGQLAPLKIMLGGKAPVAPVVASGSGTSPSTSGPAPVTTTGSSRP